MPDTVFPPKTMKRSLNAGIERLPTGGGAGTSVSSGSGAGTFGSYTQFSADLGEDAEIVGIMVSDEPNASTSLYYVSAEIATGPGASETVRTSLINNLDGSTATAPIPLTMLPVPIKVPNGTRVAVRLADSHASAYPHNVVLFWVRDANLEGY
jgi:hypothetical protein